MRGGGVIDKNVVVTFVVGTSTEGHTLDNVDFLCDGTNDRTKIQQALNSLSSKGGRILVLNGTYNMSNSLYINKNNTIFEGESTNTILKRLYTDASFNTSIIQLGADNCTIKNLTIDGNKENVGAGLANGIILHNSSRSLIGNVIEGNIFKNNNTNGIYIYFKNNSLKINNNTFQDNYSGIGGTESNEDEYLEIIDNIFEYNKIGLKIIVKFAEVSKNILRNNIDIGISVRGFNAGTLKRINIIGNIIDTSNVGMQLSRLDTSVISDNNISDCITGINGESIYDCHILRNKITKLTTDEVARNSGNNICIYSSSRTKICHNIINFGNNGISLMLYTNSNNNSEILIEGNNIFLCKTTGIWLDKANRSIVLNNIINVYTPETSLNISMSQNSSDNLVSMNILQYRDVKNEGINNTIINNKF